MGGVSKADSELFLCQRPGPQGNNHFGDLGGYPRHSTFRNNQHRPRGAILLHRPGGAIFMHWASKRTSISQLPAVRCQLRRTYLIVRFSQPLEQRNFGAGSQAGFVLTSGSADVPCAAARPPAEWEWGRCARPSIIDILGGCSPPVSPLTRCRISY